MWCGLMLNRDQKTHRLSNPIPSDIFCQVCGKHLFAELFDGQDIYFRWISMCPECYTAIGLHFGPGKCIYYVKIGSFWVFTK